MVALKSESLHRRQIEEIKFHDQKAAMSRDVHTNFYSQGALNDVYNDLLAKVGNFHDKLLLDFGCGTGWSCINFNKYGARVVGIDISFGSLIKAKEKKLKFQIESGIDYVQGSCESLPFSNKFELIIGTAILHHTQLDLTISEIKNALATGGRAYFVEPMIHNPAIQLFRYLTPNRRSKDETPLTMEFVNSLKHHFRKVNATGFGLLTLLSFILVPFRFYDAFRKLHAFLSIYERKLLKRFPVLNKYCWTVLIELEK
jgi:SAM-dependent methyltransferase